MSLGGFPSFSSIGSSLSSVTNSVKSLGGSLGDINFSSAKKGLDDLVTRASGGLGSSLNGLTSGLPNLKTALNGISGIANSASQIGQSINKMGLGGSLGALGGIATAVASAAGQLNNVLSLFRGKNLPSAGELFSAQGSGISMTTVSADDWRVRINCNFGLFGNSFDRLQDTAGVTWPYNPKISVVSKANYTQVDPVHNNYPFMGYKNSQIEDINISGEFSCETERDALYWLQATHFFKTATKMFFGGSTYAGNPPVVCQLSGYGAGVFNSVPVIIKSVTIDLPDDVNYIKCSNSKFPGSTWVPVLSTISVTVSPIYNRQLLRRFSLQDYAKGQAVGYI